MRHEEIIRLDPETLTKKSMIEAMVDRKAMTVSGKYIPADCFKFTGWTKQDMMEHLKNSKAIKEGETFWNC